MIEPDKPFCQTPVLGTAGVCKAGTCDPGYTYCDACCDIDPTCECDDLCRLADKDLCNIPHNPNVQCTCPNGVPANDCNYLNADQISRVYHKKVFFQSFCN